MVDGHITELHLGAGLRYKVRLNGITVKHIIFNERMVPMFSIVSLNLARYYDSATLKLNRTATPSSTKTPVYTKSTGVPVPGYYNP